jgi:hypothetical protein
VVAEPGAGVPAVDAGVEGEPRKKTTVRKKRRENSLRKGTIDPFE